MLGVIWRAVRRGVIVGAVLGGVLGVINWAARGSDGREPVRYALDWIVGGAALGLIAGGVRAVGDAGPHRNRPADRPGGEKESAPPQPADGPDEEA